MKKFDEKFYKTWTIDELLTEVRTFEYPKYPYTDDEIEYQDWNHFVQLRDDGVYIPSIISYKYFGNGELDDPDTLEVEEYVKVFSREEYKEKLLQLISEHEEAAFSAYQSELIAHSN